MAFDQRGTGQSGFLRCKPSRALRRAKTVTARIAACGEQLGASRGDYTSQESVEDLESLRIALGGNPLSLLAVSYGGRVAGMYAREYPQGLARMVLDSPTPVRGDSALRLEVLHALPRVLDDAICGDGACASFTQDEYGDLVRLLASLARHPITTRIFEGGRHRVSSTITENRVFSLLTEIDLPSLLRNLVPAAISAAADGSPEQLARLTAEYPPQPPPDLLEDPRGLSSEPLPVLFKELEFEADSNVLLAATVCDETELPWAADSPPNGRRATLESWIDGLPPELTAPFSPRLLERETFFSLCLGWPATAPAPPPPSGVSAVPTLILGGEDDLRTSYEEDEQVALGYSDVRLLEIPDTGHSTFTTDLSGCAHRAALEFISTGTAPASCPASRIPQAIPLPPSSLREVPPARSPSRVAGRVAAAAALTLEDILGQPSFEGGGLLGGSWNLELLRRGLALHRVVDVKGVSVSGRVTGNGYSVRGTLRIGGRLSGRLRLRGHSLRGKLGRHHVQALLQHV